MMAPYISSPKNTLAILSENGINLKKSLGQNFLIDTNILKKIVDISGAGSDDVILEIGSGIGSLTEILLPRVKKIICIEIDRSLASAFKGIFADYMDKGRKGEKIELINKDAMKIDYGELSKDFKISRVVSNLPYKVAAPLILKILVEAEGIHGLWVTIQKDIAERLTAPTGSKNYSSFAVKAQFLAGYRQLFSISRSCFLPSPNVDSVVVEIKRKDNAGFFRKNKEISGFFRFVNECFRHRRKKIINSLAQSSIYVEKTGTISGILERMGKAGDIRAEELGLGDYIELYKRLNV
ncbi:MAG: ribosomal RNA small subunit methyltransferase A [Actinobacteria bacterium]|nr:ribosomal RNA small subunit methyltransferase A [Actinomycetota bacterium]